MRIEEYGWLFRVINLTQQFSERTARAIFGQPLSAVAAMHARRIAHCDINQKTSSSMPGSTSNWWTSAAPGTPSTNSKPIPYDNSDGIGSLKCNARTDGARH